MLEKESIELQRAFKEMERKAKYNDYIIPFGIYQGCFLADVQMEDPDYFKWLTGIEFHNTEFREAIKYMEERYGKEKE